jgi:hypothetical protein
MVDSMTGVQPLWDFPVTGFVTVRVVPFETLLL